MTSPSKRNIWIAVLAGTAISLALFALNFAIDADRHPALTRLAFTAQFPGWFVCAYLLPGSLESIDTASYIAIAVPVNAAVYALIAFGVLCVRNRAGK